MYLSGKYGTLAISEVLNRDEVPRPKGGFGSATAVKRVLLHEFHMGYTSYGKREWRYDDVNEIYVVELREENEWNRGEGKHKRLKTEDEHKKILSIMNANTKLPRRSRQGVFLTTGLLYCKKCNTLMNYSIGTPSRKTGEFWDYTKCSYKTPKGEKCPQKSLKMTPEFTEVIYNAVINDYLSNEKMKNAKEHAEKHSRELALIRLKRKEIIDAQQLIVLFEKAYRAGGYTPERFVEIKLNEEKIIEAREKEIRKLEKEVLEKHLTQEELEEHVQNFKQN